MKQHWHLFLWKLGWWMPFLPKKTREWLFKQIAKDSR